MTMTQPPIPRELLDYPVLYNPAPAVARWHGRKRGLWSRGISFVVGLGIWAVLWFLSRDNLWDGFWWVFGLSTGLSLLLAAWEVGRLVVARRAVARLHEGLALGIGRGGLFVGDAPVGWPEVAGIEARPGRLDGSARLLVRTASGVVHELPLDYLGQRPAALDGAIRALSGGRCWIDLTGLDD